MPESILYAVISALVLALLALSGLWVKAQDAHRQWATSKITEHERVLSVMQSDFLHIKASLDKLELAIRDHDSREVRVHAALIAKLDLNVEED